MSRLCSFCGVAEPPNAISVQKHQAHHVAGFVNHPFFTVLVCTDCHPIFNGWQYAQRIPMRTKNKRESSGKHIPAGWGDRELPPNVRFQAVIRGLDQAYAMLSLQVDSTTKLYDISHTIRTVMRQHPDMLTGVTFGEDGDFPKVKAKNPAALPKMTTHNRERTIGALFGMLAFLIEEAWGEDHELSLTLRRIERNPLATLAEMERPDEAIILTGQVQEIIRTLTGGFNRHDRRTMASITRRTNGKARI